MADPDVIERLPLAALTFDERLQLRSDGTDSALVDEYVEAMGERPDAFPPLAAKYDGTTYWVYRGFHRGEAARRLGLRDVPVVVEPGTLDDALIAACGENAEHGSRRKRGDVTRAILALLPVIARREDFPDSWPQRRIAEVCHCGGTAVHHALSQNVDNPIYSSSIRALLAASPRGIGQREAADRRRAEAEAERERQAQAQRETERLDREQREAAIAEEAQERGRREAEAAARAMAAEAVADEREAEARAARKVANDLALARLDLERANAELEALRAVAAEQERDDQQTAAELAQEMADRNPDLARKRFKAALSAAIASVNGKWLVLHIETLVSSIDEDDRRRLIGFLSELRASVDRAESALGIRVLAAKKRGEG